MEEVDWFVTNNIILCYFAFVLILILCYVDISIAFTENAISWLEPIILGSFVVLFVLAILNVMLVYRFEYK